MQDITFSIKHPLFCTELTIMRMLLLVKFPHNKKSQIKLHKIRTNSFVDLISMLVDI